MGEGDRWREARFLDFADFPWAGIFFCFDAAGLIFLGWDLVREGQGLLTENNGYQLGRCDEVLFEIFLGAVICNIGYFMI